MTAGLHAVHDLDKEPAPVLSTITIRFPGPGASGADVAASNVTEGQFYEAAFLLDAMAREVRAGQAMRAAAARPGAVAPTPAEINALLATFMGKPERGA